MHKQIFEINEENPCFIAASPALKDLSSMIKSLASSVAPLLIQGEQGSGKEAFAFQIHLTRLENPSASGIGFYKISSNGFEGDLGKIAFVPGSTVFIERVDLLSLSAQGKILSLLRRSAEENLGLRFISSSVENLEASVDNGSFSPELYERLSAFPVRILSLKQRKEDILELSRYFLLKYSKEMGRKFTGFSSEAEKLLLEYKWPGNVDELDAVIKRSCILEQGEVIKSGNLFIQREENSSFVENESFSAANESSASRDLKTQMDAFKRSYIIKILDENNWNQTKTSKVLDIQRTYLARLMGELKIRKE